MNTPSKSSGAQPDGERAVLLEAMPSDFDLWEAVNSGKLYFTFYGSLADYANGILRRFKKANKKSQAKKARQDVLRYARTCLDRLDTVALITPTRCVIGLKAELVNIVRKDDEDMAPNGDSGSATPPGEHDGVRGSEAGSEPAGDPVRPDREVPEEPAPQARGDNAGEQVEL